MFKLSKSKSLDLARIYRRAENLYDNLPVVKKKRRRRRALIIIKYTAVSVIVLFLASFSVSVAYLTGFRDVYERGMAGRNKLEEAITLARTQEFTDARIKAGLAESDFDTARRQLRNISNGILATRLPFLEIQFDDIEYLLSTAGLLARATGQSADFGNKLKGLLSSNRGLTATDLSREERRRTLENIYISTPELNGMKATVDLAALYMQYVRTDGLLSPLAGRIDGIRAGLYETEKILGEAIPLSRMLPPLLGYPLRSSYLVVFRDSDHPSPAGIINAVGILEVEYGDIKRFDTYATDNFDLPADKADSSDVLASSANTHTDSLTNIDLSPHWPQAAARIETVFGERLRNLKSLQPSAGGFVPAIATIPYYDYNGVICLSPGLLADLLKLTGPVIIGERRYGAEDIAGMFRNDQELLGSLITEIYFRLLNLPITDWDAGVTVLRDSIDRGNILVYVKDAEVETLVRNLGLSGEMRDTTGDYVMVTDTLTGDAVDIARSLAYRLEQTQDGLRARLRLGYAPTDGDLHTYTTVFVPAGSKFIQAEGMADKIKITSELNKTAFSASVKMESGQIGNLYLEYELPDRLAARARAGEYELYVQKQPGADIGHLTIDLDWQSKVEYYSPTGFFVEKDREGHISWESDLNTDREFSVQLE